MKTALTIALLGVLAFLCSPARADDLGDLGPPDGGARMADAAPADAACVNLSGQPCPPLACDGALCDTTVGSACAVAHHRGGASGAALPGMLFLALLLVVLRRRRAIILGVLLAAPLAQAEPEPAVDVRLREPPPPRRIVSVTWNPLALLIGKVSFDVVIVPADHHGIVLNPYYVSTGTAPVYAFADNGAARQLPQQTFIGGGAEVGYRYYFGRGGPRGFFLGPSLILSRLTATAQNGTQTPYLQYGGALDIGYQRLLWDRFSLGVGGGLQIAATDRPIPPQQFPARIFANFGVFPRVLFSLGVAL